METFGFSPSSVAFSSTVYNQIEFVIQMKAVEFGYVQLVSYEIVKL